MQQCHAQTEDGLLGHTVLVVQFLEVADFLGGVVHRLFNHAAILLVNHLVIDSFKHSIRDDKHILRVQGN